MLFYFSKESKIMMLKSVEWNEISEIVFSTYLTSCQCHCQTSFSVNSLAKGHLISEKICEDIDIPKLQRKYG